MTYSNIMESEDEFERAKDGSELRPLTLRNSQKMCLSCGTARIERRRVPRIRVGDYFSGVYRMQYDAEVIRGSQDFITGVSKPYNSVLRIA